MDEILISNLEKLARLQLDSSERLRFTHELDRILEMVDHLQKLDTRGVEPLRYLNENDSDDREDEVGGQVSTEEALENAPRHDGRFFRVPKVID